MVRGDKEMTFLQKMGLVIMCLVLVIFIAMVVAVAKDLIVALNPKTRPKWWSKELTYWAVWNIVGELIGIFLIAGSILLGLGIIK